MSLNVKSNIKPQTSMSISDYQRQLCYTEKKPLNVYRGRRSKETGAAFEERISSACEKYREDGVALIRKSHELFRPVGRLSASVFKCVPTEKADPDFKGVLNNGRCIVFEAKHTDSDRIEQSRVTQHQRELLDIHQEMNALAFVLVSFGLNKFFLIPWDAWKNMKQIYGRKYIRPEELSDYEVPSVYTQGKMTVLFLQNIL